MTARGVRNNNPGNIRLVAGQTWQGQIPGEDDQYVKFSSAVYGIRGMGKLLKSYKAHGVTTIRGIVGKWAPPSENDTSSYVADVAARCGGLPDVTYDVEADGRAIPLVNAIILHECSSFVYPLDVIRAGLDMAGYAGMLTAPSRAEPAPEPIPVAASNPETGAFDMVPIAGIALEQLAAAVATAVAQQMAAATPPVVAAAVVQPAKDFSPLPPVVATAPVPVPATVPAAPSVTVATPDGSAMLRNPYATSAGMALGAVLPWLWNGVIAGLNPAIPPIPEAVAAPLTVFLADLLRQKLKIG